MHEALSLASDKRYTKLNNNEATQKRGEDGYKPAHKFDLIWRTSVKNFNAPTKEACIYLTGNETSWVHQGWGEPQIGLASIIINNIGVC